LKQTAGPPKLPCSQQEKTMQTYAGSPNRSSRTSTCKAAGRVTATEVGAWGQALLPTSGNSAFRTHPLPQPTASSLVVVSFVCPGCRAALMCHCHIRDNLVCPLGAAGATAPGSSGYYCSTQGCFRVAGTCAEDAQHYTTLYRTRQLIS
jgi:hypothetical protein